MTKTPANNSRVRRTASDYQTAATSDVFYLTNNAVLELPPSEEVVVESDARLGKDLSKLARLVANATEAYSAAIFLAYPEQQILRIEGAHSLSREFIDSAQIGYGCGLVGWAAENKNRISVCPFENDSTTLLYYKSDQDLKSFIAVPILDSDLDSENVLGVIAVDSKKSYAFAKVTEKVLEECAEQAATIIRLHRNVSTNKRTKETPELRALLTELERLRSFEDEVSLLSAAADLSGDLIKRDALVVVSSSHLGVGPGKFYVKNSKSVRNSNAVVENRLLDMVCQHKKIICPDHSVQAVTDQDPNKRSFLSVPFSVLGREAGSLNLLSPPREAFSDAQIEALERIAEVIGPELERIRLRMQQGNPGVTPGGMMSWGLFVASAERVINEAEKSRTPLTLIRLRLTNLDKIEEFAGAGVASQILYRSMRIIDQVARPPAISCALYGSDVLVLASRNEVPQLLNRIVMNLERIEQDSSGKGYGTSSAKSNLGKQLVAGLRTASAEFPGEGETLDLLADRTRAFLSEQLAAEVPFSGPVKTGEFPVKASEKKFIRGEIEQDQDYDKGLVANARSWK